MKPEILNFDEAFKISVLAQKLNGSNPFIKRNWKWMIYFFMCMAGYWTIIIFYMYNIYFDVRTRNIVEGCKHGIVCCVAFIITFKYLVMLIYQKQLQYLVQTMNINYEEAVSFTDDERLIVEKYVHEGQWVSKLWMYTTSVSTSLFPVKAIIQMIYSVLFAEPKLYWVVDISMVPELDQLRDNIFFYIIFFIGCTGCAMYSASGSISFDPSGPIFMLHACGQLEIAEEMINKIFRPKSVNKVIQSQIKIVKRLQQVHKFVSCIQDYTTVVNEMVITVTTILIPITAYEIVETLKHNEVNIEFIFFFFACIIHVYVPCHYSELLLEKSKRVAEALYFCGWESAWNRRTSSIFKILIAIRTVFTIMCLDTFSQSKRVAEALYFCGWESAWNRRTSSIFKILILHASKPIAIRTVFTIMCLDTFSQMCRTSYSIFNLMSARGN